MTPACTLRQFLGRPRVALLLGVVYLAVQAAVPALLYPISMLTEGRLQTTFSAAEFAQTLESLRSDNLLGHYWAHYLADNALPFAYAPFFAALLALALTRGRASTAADRLLVLPFVAGLLDLVENATHLWMLSHGVRPDLVILGATAACLKWAAALATAAAIVAYAARRPRETP
ncbi:MAG: hypothetical protein WBV82_29145 [Myxococcaceae bacterium]